MVLVAGPALESASVAFGYVWLERADMPLSQWWGGVIGGFCREARVPLRGVYGDFGVAANGYAVGGPEVGSVLNGPVPDAASAGAERGRGAWRALLHQVTGRAAALVVVMSLEHLSPDPDVRERLLSQLADVRARMHVVLPPVPMAGGLRVKGHG